ncbi:MAG: MmgE/PrpD family protein [Treponemataceae bacterium]
MENKEFNSISMKIADFALSLSYEDIPVFVLEHGYLLLLDTFGVAMSCKEAEHAKAINRALSAMGSSGPCTLWGSAEKVSIADAVLYNAGLIHGADYDDTHVGGIVHPSAAVVSTALVVGEYVGASGREMMTAIVAGWEIIVRLALAAKGRFHDVGYHGTGIVSPFAAACVTAKLMKLPKDVLVNALGICGSQSAALQEFLRDGSWVKKIHPGWAGHSAIYAVMMAKEGLTGPLKVFEGEFGLWKTHFGSIDGLEEQMEDFHKIWHTTEIAFKLYPVCHMTHSFIDCLLALKREYSFNADEIKSVECRIEPRCFHIVCEPMDAKKRPQTDYMMRFSLPFVVSIAAIKDRVSPWEIDIKYAKEAAVQALMDKVHCVSDEAMKNPGYFPGWVQVTLKDGTVISHQQLYESGTTQNPTNVEDVIAKYENNMSAFYTKKQIQHIKALTFEFDHLENTSDLFSALLLKKEKTTTI